MAILIVHDESQPRQAIRFMLSKAGIKPVLEARGSNDAIRICERMQAKIQLIIVGGANGAGGSSSVERLSDWVSARPYLASSPYLETTSRLLTFLSRTRGRQASRVDWTILTPFRQKALLQAIRKTYRRHAQKRDLIAWFGNPADPRIAALGARLGRSHSAGHWRELANAASRGELEALIRMHGARLGAILFDPSHAPAWNGPGALSGKWLRLFRRAPLTSVIQLACLGRTPEQTRCLRTHCRYFVELDAAHGFSDWAPELARISAGLLARWEIGNLALRSHQALQAHDVGRTRACYREVERLCPGQLESLMAKGDLLSLRGRSDAALRAYEGATRLDPCHPRPYVRLLELLGPAGTRADPRRFRSTLEQARTYCPGIRHFADLSASPGGEPR